jgi:hypothetical protein
MIRRKGNKYVLYTADGSRVLGTHPSRAEAEKQERAINVSKARQTGHRIPKR